MSVNEWRALTLEGMCIPVRIQLNGHSMRPLIRRMRDFVTIMPVTRPLKRGDVVLFADDAGRYVVHRVWKLGRDGVITLGDNCRAPDAPLRYDQIWGLVTKLERGRITLSLDRAKARLFGRLWMRLFPVRRMYWMLRAFAGRCYRKIRKR